MIQCVNIERRTGNGPFHCVKLLFLCLTCIFYNVRHIHIVLLLLPNRCAPRLLYNTESKSHCKNSYCQKRHFLLIFCLKYGWRENRRKILPYLIGDRTTVQWENIRIARIHPGEQQEQSVRSRPIKTDRILIANEDQSEI